MTEIMTTKDLAAYLRLHEVTVQRYAADGIIPSIRIGRSWRFSKEKIDEWLAGDEIGSIDKEVWDKLGVPKKITTPKEAWIHGRKVLAGGKDGTK